jgi:hypothetical protein
MWTLLISSCRVWIYISVSVCVWIQWTLLPGPVYNSHHSLDDQVYQMEYYNAESGTGAAFIWQHMYCLSSRLSIYYVSVSVLICCDQLTFFGWGLFYSLCIMFFCFWNWDIDISHWLTNAHTQVMQFLNWRRKKYAMTKTWLLSVDITCITCICLCNIRTENVPSHIDLTSQGDVACELLAIGQDLNFWSFSLMVLTTKSPSPSLMFGASLWIQQLQWGILGVFPLLWASPPFISWSKCKYASHQFHFEWIYPSKEIVMVCLPPIHFLVLTHCITSRPPITAIARWLIVISCLLSRIAYLSRARILNQAVDYYFHACPKPLLWLLINTRICTM